MTNQGKKISKSFSNKSSKFITWKNFPIEKNSKKGKVHNNLLHIRSPKLLSKRREAKMSEIKKYSKTTAVSTEKESFVKEVAVEEFRDFTEIKCHHFYLLNILTNLQSKLRSDQKKLNCKLTRPLELLTLNVPAKPEEWVLNYGCDRIFLLRMTAKKNKGQ